MRTPRRNVTLVVLALVALGGRAGAERREPAARMDHRDRGGTTRTAAPRAYEDVMMKMHRDMDITYSGDPDRDFASGMLPHHRGAVDMAKVELRYGRDPQMRRLARAIVASQAKEIVLMQAWRARHAR